MTDDTPKPEAPEVAPPAATAAAPEGEVLATAAPGEAPAETTAESAPEPAADAAVGTAPPEAAAADAKAEMSPAATGARLAELFPALFAAPARPIKLRIQADIQERAPGVFTKKGLSLFLHRHTTSTAYLRALVGSPTRFDLDGQAAGEIADEHREAAKVEVERRRAIVEAKRAAERDAMRQRQREQGREQGRGAPREGQPATGPQAEGAAPPPRRDSRPDRRRPERPADRRPDRPPRPEPRAMEPRPVEARHAEAPPAEPPVRDADFEARRERAALLRAYETSTITRANFCVLKRISEADLDAALAVARKEREDRPPMPPRHDAAPRPQNRPPHPQGERRPGGPRPEGRGPRPPGRGRPPENAPR